MTHDPLPDDALPPFPDLAPGRYRHYKGGLYVVTAVALHSETLEPMVVYQSADHPGRCWVRPHAMFTGRVTMGDRTIPRFSRID